MAQTHKMRPAPAVAGSGPRKIDRPPRAIFAPNNPHDSQAQARCKHCAHALLKRKRGYPGRRQHFCSSACRVASSREKARFEAAGYNHPWCYETTSKTVDNSYTCEARKGHPYPSRFSIPVDILGRGHRWPGAPKLDRETRDKIAWREIGRAP